MNQTMKLEPNTSIPSNTQPPTNNSRHKGNPEMALQLVQQWLTEDPEYNLFGPN
jgi:hypothetical protein